MSIPNILFFSPYYNNSHFIPLQIKSFRKYLKNCKWKLIVIDDSSETTINILSNEKEDIRAVCDNFPDEVIYHKFPLTHYTNDVPFKHRHILNYAVSHLSEYYHKPENGGYNYLASLDADMCFIKDFDVINELSGYDIIGPLRIQWLSYTQLKTSNPYFKYFFVHCIFYNLDTIPDLHLMKMDAIPNTWCDTGSMIIEFINKRPTLKLKYIEIPATEGRYHNVVDQPVCLKCINNFQMLYNNHILHYSSGSLWYMSENDIKKKYEMYKKNLSIFEDMIYNGISSDLENMIENEKKQDYDNKVMPHYSYAFSREACKEE
jgi:hypothetical protein